MAIDPSRTDDDVLGALGREPGLAAIARPGAAVLILSRDGGRLLFASRAAREFRPIEAWRNGQVSDDPLREAVRALALRAERGPGLRFERLRLGGARLSPPTTCACRQVALRTGEMGVLIVLLDAKPNLPSQRATGGPEPHVAPTDLPAEEESSGASGPAFSRREPARGAAAKAEPGLPDRGNPAETLPRLRGRGTVRFVWEADAEARFTFVSPALATAVGEDGAAIVGRRWGELAGDVIADRAEINDLFARRETWSGRTVRWRVTKTPVGVAVDLAGTPILGPDRTVTGFRGFGLVRTDALTWWTADEAAQAEPHDAATAEAIGQAPDEARPEGGDTVTGEEGSEGEGAAASAPGEDARTASTLDIHAPPTSPARDEILRSSDKADDENGPDSSDAGPESAAAATPADVALPPPEAGRTHSPATEAEAVPPEAHGGAVRPAPVAPRLSHAERSAFRDIARALGARLRENDPPEDGAEPSRPDEAARSVVPLPEPSEAVERVRPGPDRSDGRAILGRLPLGVLIYRGDDPLFANRALLEMAGHDDVESIRAAGGMARLLPRRAGPPLADEAAPLALSTRGGGSVPVEIRPVAVEWDGLLATLLLVREAPRSDEAQRLPTLEQDLAASQAKARELAAVLDTATDGVVVIDDDGRILSLNRSAEALFGYDRNEVAGDPLVVLLAPESHATALDYLQGLRTNVVRSVLNDGREVMGRVRQGGSIPLFLTLGRLADGPEQKFCAVLRDVTAVKKAEAELDAAKRTAEAASTRKTDLLAKVSHEIRTPLNAIIGFAEVMLEGRFGPVGNERYKDYVKDIHESGRRVVSLVDDLLDLARIEAGRMELTFTSVNLNEVVGAAIALMQPQAARERIVVRTSFAARLPGIVADERSVRQIATNLVSNAIKFTEAGGQVIVSTAVTDRGEVAFRVRDTGAGMTADEIEAALEPFRPLATARPGGGPGLGLPLAKALAEANRAALHISSARAEGTLAEVLFPPTRVLAG